MINLIEYGAGKFIPDSLLTKEDRVFLNEVQGEDATPRFYLKEVKDGIQVKPLNYVGVIQLDKVKINIFPRFSNRFRGLMQMLAFCHGLEYDYYKCKTRGETGESNLPDIIIGFMLEEIEKIFKQGAFREYRTYEGNLKYLRGRVDLKKQLSQNYLIASRLYCRYDELDTDIIENQIILKALEVARKIANNPRFMKTASRYYHFLKNYCKVYRGKTMPEISYHRLNYYYREAHYYARLLIENIGSRNIYRGQSQLGYTLLLDMNELFEVFVARLFTTFLGDKYLVRPQRTVTDAITDKNNYRYRDIIPDLYLEDKKTGRVTIIDTKNKNYGNVKVQSHDIYQLAFYGMYFFDYFQETANVIILYPAYEDVYFTDNVLYLNSYKNKGQKNSPAIKVRALNVNLFLQLIESRAKDEIKRLLRELVG